MRLPLTGVLCLLALAVGAHAPAASAHYLHRAQALHAVELAAAQDCDESALCERVHAPTCARRSHHRFACRYLLRWEEVVEITPVAIYVFDWTCERRVGVELRPRSRVVRLRWRPSGCP